MQKIIVFIFITIISILLIVLHYFGIIYLPLFGQYIPLYSYSNNTTKAGLPKNEYALANFDNNKEVSIPMWCFGMTNLNQAINTGTCEYEMNEDIQDIVVMQNENNLIT